jgi:hypothetical protein
MANHRYKMISSMRYSIGIYERFYKVQRAAIFEYFKSKSRLKLDSSKELELQNK